MCHVSCILCHVSSVTCQMSHVTCQKNIDKVGKPVCGGSVINGATPSSFYDFSLVSKTVTLISLDHDNGAVKDVKL